MNIYESLENLNVSEECFNDIMGIVEEIINELNDSTVASMLKKRKEIERKTDDRANYADSVGETALRKAKKEKDKDKIKQVSNFINKAYNDQIDATRKRLKSQRTTSNWARKMRGVNVSFDDKGNAYLDK